MFEVPRLRRNGRPDRFNCRSELPAANCSDIWIAPGTDRASFVLSSLLIAPALTVSLTLTACLRWWRAIDSARVRGNDGLVDLSGFRSLTDDISAGDNLPFPLLADRAVHRHSETETTARRDGNLCCFKMACWTWQSPFSPRSGIEPGPFTFRQSTPRGEGRLTTIPAAHTTAC